MAHHETFVSVQLPSVFLFMQLVSSETQLPFKFCDLNDLVGNASGLGH